MYAIIETGGKQYRVSEGDILKIERIDNKKSVTFNHVLMTSDGKNVSVGKPFISSAKVTAEVMGEDKAKKVLVFKQKPRKGHRKLRGHRQTYTTVKIKDIQIK
ncbi:MAG TPA: 50S ribosomal protein L21 [Nitrospirae bacterium]|nr:50S ribosomal protein L21 [bacterium BMS3Abin10]GBE40099.1 50S ribosomal protein L21 [bacterium BMS3Bbin08]HDH50758.1 50S ribosomal protein L21 [Nitrospirota bacterium]HDK81661.1 50S ribosomal protein L21 [Nitrospirota bacterium]HDO25484.1 50S ribosomal protein L21 [Nitrospirota bacterium]